MFSGSVSIFAPCRKGKTEGATVGNAASSSMATVEPAISHVTAAGRLTQKAIIFRIIFGASSGMCCPIVSPLFLQIVGPCDQAAVEHADVGVTGAAQNARGLVAAQRDLAERDYRTVARHLV